MSNQHVFRRLVLPFPLQKSLGFSFLSLIFGLFLLPCIGLTQVTNVNSAIKIISGEPFYIHTVLEGQTIEQIAEAYYTVPLEISRANPEIRTGLVTGIKLKIPFSEASSEAMSKREALQSDDAEGASNAPAKVAPKTAAKPASITKREPEEDPTTPSVPIIETISTPQPTPIQEAISLIEAPAPKSESPEQTLPSTETYVNTPTEAAEATEATEAAGTMEGQSPGAAPITAAENETPTQSEATETAEMEPESQQALADLNALSTNIRESLDNLERIRQALEQPAPVDPLTGELLPDSTERSDVDPNRPRVFVGDYVENQMTNFFDTNARDSLFHLREFFLMHITQDGQIQQVRDERTVTNENTHMLDIRELKGMTLNGFEIPAAGQPLAVGLLADVKRYDYKATIKRKRVRIYRTKGYVEHLPKKHPHSILILEAAKNAGKRGPAHVVILEGTKAISTYQPFEYNPFHSVDQSLFNEYIIRIDQLTFD